MKKILYIIDKTSRQYSFEVPKEGLKLQVLDSIHTITEDEDKKDVFYDLIRNKIPFVLSSNKNSIIFSADQLIGVQIVTQE